MATVIQNDSLAKHSVEKYNFKVIAFGSNEDKKEETKDEIDSPKFTPEKNPKARSSDIDSSALSTSSKDSLIESLMQKTDEMSSNFIKLQMKLESKEEEYLLALEKAKESAFSQGIEAGKAQAVEDGDKSITNSLEQFASSVKTLDASAKVFEESLEAVKSELIFAALDISKEVIKVELAENSNEVAKLLSDELIKDLQSASKITLKVNPKDHGSISEHLGKLEQVAIVSDSAVSPGGVIVVSDAGNIDAQISKRFERVKKAALNE
jgi:flagellar assembly protein FliH